MTLADYRHWASTPNTDRPVLSVVIPTYNEEWRILPTIGAIATHVSSMGIPWELIIADDGSTDTTIELVKALDLVNLRLLIAGANGGKGSAVRRGFQAAEGDYILFADADQSTPIEQLDLLLEEIQSGNADIAIGSRAAGGATVRSKGTVRKLASWGLNKMIQTLYPLRIEDTQCGFKLFSGHSGRALFDLQLIDGFSFDLEVLYLAYRLGFKVIEVPVEWIDAPGSTVSTSKVAVQFVRDLIIVRSNELRGRYRTTTKSNSGTGTAGSTSQGDSEWKSSEKEQGLASSHSAGASTPTNAMSSTPTSTR